MLDILGHPIRVGDTVLTAPYWGINKTLITKVLKVNKKTIVVKVPEVTWDFKNKKTFITEKRIKRTPDKFICVEAQIKHNKQNFPEYCI